MYILLHLVAAGARRRRGGGLVAAALAQAPVTVRILGAHAGDQLPVDDRVRLAPAFEARAADGRVSALDYQ